MFTVYQLSNDDLKNKEHLNSDELDCWMDSVYGKYPTIMVVNDESSKFLIYTDNGEKFIISDRGVR